MSRRIRVAAKKRLGQHFLRDTGILRRIVDLLAPERGQVVLEVGSGDGALAKWIAPRAGKLLAVELDPECWPVLEDALSPFPTAEIVKGDILAIDLTGLVGPLVQSGFRLVAAGNLPYNIGTAIIDRLLDLEPAPEKMLFMVQLEVAQRITAVPGTREYGVLSVLCQHRAAFRLEFAVPPACFVPRPRVMSAVLSIRPRILSLGTSRENELRALVKAAFAHRRKTLMNSLLRDARFGALAHRALEVSRLDGARRPESLSVEEFETLADSYHKLSH